MNRAAVAILAISCAACVATPASIGPSGSVPTSTASPSSPSPSAPVTTPSPTEDPKGYSEVASFGSEDTVTAPRDVVETPFGLVAVGTRYLTAVLPLFGSVAREGQVWRSSDGLAWENETPADVFRGAELEHVFVAGDGSIVVTGYYDDPDSEEDLPRGRIWRSTDGASWRQTDDLGTSSFLRVSHGPKGHVAVVVDMVAGGSELWHSPDGLEWHTTRADNSRWRDVGAGPQGFVAVGSNASGTAGRIVASSDGQTWIVAEDPPDLGHVIPRDANWLGMDALFSDTVRFSENGLTWRRFGTHPLDTVDPCREYISSLFAIEELLVSATVLSFPCSEGGLVANGHVRQSTDTLTWTELVPPGQAGSGQHTVTMGLSTGAHVVLIGQVGTRATFWADEVR